MIIALVFLFVGIIMIAATFTMAGGFLAAKLGVLDHPDNTRHWHQYPVALWGGIPLFLVFWGVIFWLYRYQPLFGITALKNGLAGLFFGSAILLFIGIADDIKPFAGPFRLILIAIGLAVAAYFMPIAKITNPWGGVINLPVWAGSALVFFWLLITTISTKVLDGIDGLATSVVAAGSLVIALMTLSKRFFQPNVFLVAMVFVAVLLGFLFFNWPRASVFLGESGSLFIGFILGGLAVLAGSKMATALLVMAVPVLDVARVAFLRWRAKRPLFEGDRNHLHFVLLDKGWQEWQIVTLLTAVALLAGLAALWLQSYQKILALVMLSLGFLLFAAGVTMRAKKLTT